MQCGIHAALAVNTAQRELPPHLVATPRIVNTAIPQDDRSELGEMTVSAGP
jgi:hypothetical protein